MIDAVACAQILEALLLDDRRRAELETIQALVKRLTWPDQPKLIDPIHRKLDKLELDRFRQLVNNRVVRGIDVSKNTFHVESRMPTLVERLAILNFPEVTP